MSVMKKYRPIAVITGAAGGIGKALVKTFTQQGYRVVAIDLVNTTFRGCEFVEFDISRLHRFPGESHRILTRIREIVGGRLNVLVNNAAIQIVKPIAEVSAADWDKTLATNLLAPFWFIRGLLLPLRRAHGCVVNIASIHAVLTKPTFALYATSKAALVGLTRSLALELAPKVRVNAVLPAATDTGMLRAGFAGRPKGMDRLREFHPLNRIATPKEIADAVSFLSSAKSNFITGTAVCVDGGIGACLHDPGIVTAC